MVVRTGFNTTKGSLVRSMLFPRPNKFRFYRDSFRFIGVMALIAGLGFCISIVNFINLGVFPSQVEAYTDALAFYYCEGIGFDYHYCSAGVTCYIDDWYFIRFITTSKTRDFLY